MKTTMKRKIMFVNVLFVRVWVMLYLKMLNHMPKISMKHFLRHLHRCRQRVEDDHWLVFSKQKISLSVDFPVGLNENFYSGRYTWHVVLRWMVMASHDKNFDLEFLR